ncbi:hypothetical protein ACFV1L_20965 [Kitasatospora sp. NPDC059646]|uniref:hypothetical protein n=1 Tax=Kitasatospora sp. NPDC059646 TaxID=3346893 RepID=UPI003685DEF7
MSITVTADPASPEERGAAAVTAIVEAVKAAAQRPHVDRAVCWRITGTPYSAARLTVADLAARIAEMPEQLPVLLYVPDVDCRDAVPVRSTTWDGALVLHTTETDPDPDILPLDPAPAGAHTAATGRLARTGQLTAADLRAALAGLPDHAPVMATVPGWAGTGDLVVESADDYGTCLVLDTDYPTCDPYGEHEDD